MMYGSMRSACGRKDSADSKARDADKMRKGPKIRVEFTVIRGELHVGVDSNGLADPYIKIGKPDTARDKTQAKKWYLTTPILPKCMRPEWNYSKKANVWPGRDYNLIVELWDHNVVHKDKLVARGFLPIKYGYKEPEEIQLSLTETGAREENEIATVLLKIEKLPEKA
eukprot:TRINITY_DN23996_c0_g1_i1.p1 TRINITY_DN23996_c0_g1~~TRINITY_DN23996_c0_g1_i1.p1  ORF type:complete len:168 (+),score=22.40 TRINITY_DN23996_c0_g1_i1:246-749(+)